MARRTNGWKLVKTLTAEETADARSRMGLDEAGLRRSREEARQMEQAPKPMTLDEAYALQAQLEDEHQDAVKARRMSDASRLRERLEDLAREYGL